MTDATDILVGPRMSHRISFAFGMILVGLSLTLLTTYILATGPWGDARLKQKYIDEVRAGSVMLVGKQCPCVRLPLPPLAG